MNVDINYGSVAVAALSTMVVGSLWFGPLFGRQFIAIMKFTPEQVDAMKKKGMAGMWKTYVGQLIGSLFMADVMAYVIMYANAYNKTSGAFAGAHAAFWVWLGVAAPVLLGAVLWEGKSKQWFLLNAGYYLVSMTVIGAILGGMM